MTTLREAAQQALGILCSEFTTVDGEFCRWCDGRLNAKHNCALEQTITALRAALAQQDEPVQEPVAYIHRQGNHWEVSERFLLDDEKARGWTEEPLYTAPPQRKPLTKEQFLYIYNQLPNWGMDMDSLPQGLEKFGRAVERAHGIGEQP